MNRVYIGRIINGILLLAALSVVVWFIWQMNSKRTKASRELYQLVAADPELLLQVNRPELLRSLMLAQPAIHELFQQELPPLFMELVTGYPLRSAVLFSFHPQGVVCYTKISPDQFKQIQSFLVQKTTAWHAITENKPDAMPIHYYPAGGNQFLGLYYHEDILVASYSRRLLESAALSQQTNQKNLTYQAEQALLAVNQKAPLIVLFQADLLDLSVPFVFGGSRESGNRWLSADLFTHDNRICYFGTLPFYPEMETLYQPLNDSLKLKLETSFPMLELNCQVQTDAGKVYYSGCYN